MRFAVLCSGPSLLRYPGKSEGRYDAVIGVNRAVALRPCDYWCHLDMIFHLLEHRGEPCIGTPTIITHRSCWKQTLRNWPKAESWPWLDVRTMDYIDAEAKWRIFSSTTAIVAAAHLGAKEIDAFGVDWSGTADCDGFSYPDVRRGQERWDKERETWAYCARQLEARGVTLRRIGHDVPEAVAC